MRHRTVLYLFLSCFVLNCWETMADKGVDKTIVELEDGTIRGFVIQSFGGKDVLAFQGIPFAQPPVGNLRFREPVKNLPWEGVRDAIELSPTCIQTELFQMYKVVGQEDCLYLNVYTPKLPIRITGVNDSSSTTPLPVMVGIHEGGFIFGNSHHMGPTYLMDHNVVLVTMNYRLGALGFLSTVDDAVYGNNGLKDQVLALQWVQENIHHFGGDPNSVTLFGESAGAGSTHFHMLSPLSKGLFHRGISQSGCAFCFWSINENPMHLTTTLANAFNCTSHNNHELVDCLRGVNATDFVAAQLLLLEWAGYPVALVAPVIEPPHPGAFIDDLPENIYKKPDGVAKVPWIAGINSDELSINLANILLDPALVNDFNDQWTTKVGPAMMEITRNSTEDPQSTLAAVWEHYMGNDSMSFDTRKKAVQMLSDRYLGVCTHKAIRYHAQYTGMPVYGYFLDYSGKYGVVQMLGQDPKDWGVAHMDDLIYLVNNTEYYATLQPVDEEYGFSQILTSLWTNFAIHGKPLLTTAGNTIELWEPVLSNTTENLIFLNLNLNPKMIPDPFTSRIQFWESLGLTERDNELNLTKK